MAQSMRERWEASVRKKLDLYRQVAESTETMADFGVGDAIGLFVFEYRMPVAIEILRHDIARIRSLMPGEPYEKLLADKANLDQETRVNINYHKVRYVRELAYAQLMLDGTLDAARMQEAIDAFEDTFAFVKPRDWDLPNEWNVHSAALMALVAGDHARAASFLASKRSFKDTQVYHDALKRLVAGIVKHGGRLPLGSEEAKNFERLFDIVRQPEPNATAVALGDQGVGPAFTLPLEFALVKERYLTGNAGAPDLRRVFASISQ